MATGRKAYTAVVWDLISQAKRALGTRLCFWRLRWHQRLTRVMTCRAEQLQFVEMQLSCSLC
eukprot:1208130-Amphidinium_carterae.1